MIGQTISHYRIHAMLGEGGMGAVYRAKDLTLGRDVALKFLPAETAADAESRRRLLREAQSASRLNHPNIATIYEVNTEGRPFISMELVAGRTLRQALLSGAFTPEQFLPAARQIAEGLQEAHRVGVCHRDIKPANIMLDTRARVKILDFGLAELSQPEHTLGEADATLTMTRHSTAGTVPYMSPEQLRGESVDARSDIFSFGVLMYECLTGRLPFRGETAIDTLYAILRTPHIPLRTLVPSIDPEWDKLVDRCLAKSPEQRCASMDEVLVVLSKIETRSAAAAAPLHAEKSIAVLYFDNLGGSQEDEYFRDGMTEDIITELTKISELQLLPRSAVLAFRDKPQSVSQIGQQLAVAYVLQGSLRRSGNRLRITAQLAETRTGRSVWAERYDRQLEDIFAIQDEIAQNIARSLRIMLSDTEKRAIERVPTRDIQAYDYYLRGRQAFLQLRHRSVDFARQMFARAIVLDPAYAAALAGVANCGSFLCMYFESTPENLREAITASRRAVELDPESAEAHASRGLAESLGKNYAEAEREFETAIRLNPKLYETFYFYGRASFAQGNMEKAALLFRKASELDAADYQSLMQLEGCLRALHRDDEARQVNRHAVHVIERHLQHDPGDARALYLGSGAALLIGDRERALDWANRALAIDPEESAVLYNIACTYTHLGETDRALDLLEKAVRNGFGHKEWLENDPDFIPVRSHPRFQALLQVISKRNESNS